MHCIWKRVPGLLLLASLGALAAPTPAAAQSCNGPGNYTLQADPVQIDFPAPTATDYDNGYVESGPFRIRVRPSGQQNRSWELCIGASDATLGGTKPISDVKWQLDGAGPDTWLDLTQSETPVTPGFGNQWVTFRFRVALDWALDGPGTYQAEVLFVSHRS
jgi:hypothetical protein